MIIYIYYNGKITEIPHYATNDIQDLFLIGVTGLRFLTSFGMTAILFLVRRGKGGIAALSSPKTSNTTVIPNVAKRNEESLAMMILSKSQG